MSPSYRRQSSRLALLKGFIEPPQVPFEEFNAWRDNSRMMISVNSQVKVPEEYLRKKYNESVRVKIVTYNNMLLSVGLLGEGRAVRPEFGSIGESCFQSVPPENEVRDKFDSVDFVVYVPLEVDGVLVGAEIEKHRQASTTYKITQR